MQEVGLLSLTSEPRDALVMLVVMAVSNARGRFIVIDVGAYGSFSDGRILQDSTFINL